MYKVNVIGLHTRQMDLEPQQSSEKPTYECCEWYGCALACVPIPACWEQSYPHNGYQHWNERICWMTVTHENLGISGEFRRL